MTSITRTSITLTNIICVSTQEPAGSDEVFVYFQADGGAAVRIPYRATETESMQAGDNWDIGHTASFVNDLQVTLYEADPAIGTMGSDYIVNWTYTPLDIPAEITLTNGSAKYTLRAKRETRA
jgi:hypothetical protein